MNPPPSAQWAQRKQKSRQHCVGFRAALCGATGLRLSVAHRDPQPGAAAPHSGGGCSTSSLGHVARAPSPEAGSQRRAREERQRRIQPAIIMLTEHYAVSFSPAIGIVEGGLPLSRRRPFWQPRGSQGGQSRWCEARAGGACATAEKRLPLPAAAPPFARSAGGADAILAQKGSSAPGPAPQ